MIKKRLLHALVPFLLLASSMTAQEFNFTVKVATNPSQGRIADPKVFTSLETALKELINNTKWTDDVFEQNERLTGSIQLTIKNEISTKNIAPIPNEMQ